MDWKKIGHYVLYTIPGYGVYDQVKKPKGKRSALGFISSGIVTAFFIVKLALLPAYIGKVAATGNWHPFRFNSKYDETEQVYDTINYDTINKSEKIEKENKLEKTINYEDIIKDIP